jgi:hypothetical protein
MSQETRSQNGPERKSEWKLEDTGIEIGGVFRCCTGTVAREYTGQIVKVGATSQCQQCKRKFTLKWVGPDEMCCYTKSARLKFPIWRPDDP